MKYLEFTFRTVPCTEIVNDVLSGVLGEAGFEVLLSRPTVSLLYTERAV